MENFSPAREFRVIIRYRVSIDFQGDCDVGTAQLTGHRLDGMAGGNQPARVRVTQVVEPYDIRNQVGSRLLFCSGPPRLSLCSAKPVCRAASIDAKRSVRRPRLTRTGSMSAQAPGS